jgi:ABC-type antimicrobial peptide transport system permease subunit
MTLAVVGIAIGVAGGLVLYRLMGVLLYDVSPTDTASFVFGSAVLAGVAFLASVMPARRATRVNPIEVLHEE